MKNSLEFQKRISGDFLGGLGWAGEPPRVRLYCSEEEHRYEVRIQCRFEADEEYEHYHPSDCPGYRASRLVESEAGLSKPARSRSEAA